MLDIFFYQSCYLFFFFSRIFTFDLFTFLREILLNLQNLSTMSLELSQLLHKVVSWLHTFRTYTREFTSATPVADIFSCSRICGCQVRRRLSLYIRNFIFSTYAPYKNFRLI